MGLDCDGLAGKRGQLVADVVETRQSGHIGDFFAGHSTSCPEEGERIVLGTGTLFAEKDQYDGAQDCAGLRPDDGRKYNWLDPEALYRAHDQTVVLSFIPDEN